MRYETSRSVKDKSLHVICVEGTFDDLPTVIRHLGPWQGLEGGPLQLLRPMYRALVEVQGFCIAYVHASRFSTEAPKVR